MKFYLAPPPQNACCPSNVLPNSETWRRHCHVTTLDDDDDDDDVCLLKSHCSKMTELHDLKISYSIKAIILSNKLMKKNSPLSSLNNLS